MKIDVFRNIFFFLTLGVATAMQRKQQRQQQQNSLIKSWTEKNLDQLCLNCKLPSLKINLVVCVCTHVHTHVCLHKSVPAIQHDLSFFQK